MMDRLFANFFWGSSSHGSKHHWKSWSSLCKSIEQGGLGIMSLRQMELALRVKMLWRALFSDSLWANFFRSKYIKHQHIMDVQFKNMKGHARKSWLQARDLIGKYQKVIIGDGESTNFWRDIWMGDQPLSSFLHDSVIPNKQSSVSKVLLHPSPDETECLNTYLPADIVRAINTTRLANVHDKKVWSLSASGHCDVSSIYKISGGSNQVFQLYPWTSIWSPQLPPRLSMLLWKILNNCLATDYKVQSIGIQLCSKCHCCTQPHRESLHHLFIESETASYIWSSLSNEGFLIEDRSSLKALILKSVTRYKTRTLYGLFSLAVISSSLSEIWAARNLARYEGKNTAKSYILHSIIV